MEDSEMEEHGKDGSTQASFRAATSEATEVLAVRSARHHASAMKRSGVIYVRASPDEVTEVFLPQANTQVEEMAESDETQLVMARPSRLYVQAIENVRKVQSSGDEQKKQVQGPVVEKGERAKGQKQEAGSGRGVSKKRAWGIQGSQRPTHGGKRTVLRVVLSVLLVATILCSAGVLYYERVQAQQSEQRAELVQRMQAIGQREQQQAQGEQQAAAQVVYVQKEAHMAVQQFQREVVKWGQAHLYSDSYDGKKYTYDSGYAQQGIGVFLSNDLADAQTTADYEAVIGEAQNDLFDLQMLEADYNDHTPYNMVHKTDKMLLDRYNLEGKSVLVVSLAEQVLRVYRQGKLVGAFYVTTGRPERPSLPGVWPVLDRESPIVFVSSDPPGSPFWFPNTPISYAINYHEGGFFFHDASWRVNFGPGTQFPHQDASGNTPYNFDGSHGCINLTTADAAWVYMNTSWSTEVLIY
jgi:hypothetical protein